MLGMAEEATTEVGVIMGGGVITEAGIMADGIITAIGGMATAGVVRDGVV